MFASGNEELVLTRLETFRMGSCSKLAKINGSRRTPGYRGESSAVQAKPPAIG
jgi:hypothetical protein